jgi:hypothetical protein
MWSRSLSCECWNALALVMMAEVLVKCLQAPFMQVPLQKRPRNTAREHDDRVFAAQAWWAKPLFAKMADGSKCQVCIRSLAQSLDRAHTGSSSYQSQYIDVLVENAHLQSTELTYLQLAAKARRRLQSRAPPTRRMGPSRTLTQSRNRWENSRGNWGSGIRPLEQYAPFVSSNLYFAAFTTCPQCKTPLIYNSMKRANLSYNTCIDYLNFSTPKPPSLVIGKKRIKLHDISVYSPYAHL